MLKLNEKYLGEAIIAQAINDVVRVNNVRVRIPLKKISNNAIYSFKNNGNKIVMQHHNNSWGCSTETLNDIQKHGNEIINKMFGDIFADIDTVMGERK